MRKVADPLLEQIGDVTAAAVVRPEQASVDLRADDVQFDGLTPSPCSGTRRRTRGSPPRSPTPERRSASSTGSAPGGRSRRRSARGSASI